MKNKFWILGIVGVIVLIIIISFSSPKTNKDKSFSKTENSLYQNTNYNFSINFPEGWKISSNESGDSQAVVQKATKGNAVVSVAVRDVPLAVDVLSSEEKSIKDIIDFEKFKQQTKTDMEKAVSGINNFEFGEMFINEIPAYWAKFSGPNSANNSLEDTVKQYHFFYKNVLYMISTTSNSNDFSNLEAVFNTTINSFKIIK